MNRSIVRYILGTVLKIEGVLLLLPCLIALIYRESDGWWYLLFAGVCLAVGLLSTIKKPSNTVFYLKEGCAATAFSWIVLSFFGAMPLFFSGAIPGFVNTLFETVSGFTTTGASILDDIESLSHCALFWRSFTHWIGGMGILVFVIAIMPLVGSSNFNLMRAESPGPSVGKLVPRLKQTAQMLYIIYFSLTALEFLFLLCGGLPVFDALTTAVSTAGTGGFSIKGDSIGAYSVYTQWVVAVFMLLFGVNFNAYYLILLRQFRKVLHLEEVRWYLILYAASVLIIFLSLLSVYENAFGALTDSVFSVSSLLSSTGFSTANFDLWPATAKIVLLCVMFIGACAGSTGGGIKVSRILILFKSMIKGITSYVHPKSIKKITMEEKPVEEELVRSVNVFFVAFLGLFALSALLLSLDPGTDATTSVTAAVSALSNMGPGFSLVGPACNYAFLSVGAKIVLMFDMLAGRLELFPILVLFHPGLWNVSRPARRSKESMEEDDDLIPG